MRFECGIEVQERRKSAVRWPLRVDRLRLGLEEDFNND